MYKFIFLLLLTHVITARLPASDASYQAVMQQYICQLSLAGSVDELQQLAGEFTKVSQVHADEWLPPYYAALAYANMGYISTDAVSDRDALFDEAVKYMDQAQELSGNTSEIASLKGYILMGKLYIDPSRAQMLSPQAIQVLTQAIRLDSNNPRARIIMANMQLGMAEFMGQSTNDACAMADSAHNLFQKEAQQINRDVLAPRWGMELVERMSSLCP